jgi:hypothetical protein
MAQRLKDYVGVSVDRLAGQDHAVTSATRQRRGDRRRCRSGPRTTDSTARRRRAHEAYQTWRTVPGGASARATCSSSSTCSTRTPRSSPAS